jgi:hypothetical protein
MYLDDFIFYVDAYADPWSICETNVFEVIHHGA